MKNIRIKTEPINDSDKYIQVKVDQTFDNLEVLSLKLTQKNSYFLNSSDYGAVVGRCYTNNGLGIPNVRVSIFVPISDQDKLDANVFTMYPYETIDSLDSEFQRYNVLPDEQNGECHIPVGRFPSKNAILDNPELQDIYIKYYKFTTETNKAGDYMFFGIPLGTYSVVIDCDLSDIDIYSQRPYDMVEQGASEDMFDSMTQFPSDKSLNMMPHIITKRTSVNVNPFWGDTEDNIIGISRLDIDLGYVIEPKAIFVGSIFGDNEKNSVNKNCQTRRDVGKLCETTTGSGTIEMLRETIDGDLEIFNIDGGDLIDDNGNWAYRVPMNLDYMVTDESGMLIPSDDPKKGIPTRASVRFRIGMDETGGEGRIRTRAKFLVPHNPRKGDEVDYEFSNSTSPNSMRDMYWNKIYTIKQYIPRVQRRCPSSDKLCAKMKTAIYIKDVDDCIGGKNPFPYNKFNGSMNPLYSIICIIISIIITVIHLINNIFSRIANIKIAGWRPFKWIKCIKIECNDNAYYPGCRGRSIPNDSRGTTKNSVHECFKQELAETIKIYSFEFFNDWINGTLYAFLLKYKKKKNNRTKFCDYDSTGRNSYIVNTVTNYMGEPDGKIKFHSVKKRQINRGYIKEQPDGELYYAPYVDQTKILFATDIYELGAVFDCDWQAKPKIHEMLIPTTYQMPPKINEEDHVTEYANDKGGDGLLFGFSCVDFDMNEKQIISTNRICEIGSGLDEDRDESIVGNTIVYGSPKNKIIDKADLESIFIRDALIYLNDVGINPNDTITSDFDEPMYKHYRTNGELDTSLGMYYGNSFYFYFGTNSNQTSLDLMNKKYFTPCLPNTKEVFNVRGVVTDASKIGENDGTIRAIFDGDFPPYEYLWDNGDTGEVDSETTRTGLEAGIYSIKVTDKEGNVSRKNFKVGEPDPLGALISTQSPLSLTGTAQSTGRINVESIYGGTPNYRIDIYRNDGTLFDYEEDVTNDGKLIYNLVAGTYDVVITDGGVSVPYEETVIVKKYTELKWTAMLGDDSEDGDGHILCTGADDAIISMYVSSGEPAYHYEIWSPPNKNGSGKAGRMTQYFNAGETIPYEWTGEGDTGYAEDVYVTESRNAVVPYKGDMEINSGLNAGTYFMRVRDEISVRLQEWYETNNEDINPDRRIGVPKSITINEPDDTWVYRSQVTSPKKYRAMAGLKCRGGSHAQWTLIINGVLSVPCRDFNFLGDWNDCIGSGLESETTLFGYEFEDDNDDRIAVPEIGTSFQIISNNGCVSDVFYRTENDYLTENPPNQP